MFKLYRINQFSFIIFIEILTFGDFERYIFLYILNFNENLNALICVYWRLLY
jgi:hypothetical protein